MSTNEENQEQTQTEQLHDEKGRPAYKFHTSRGNEVVIRTYITGREQDELQQIQMKGVDTTLRQKVNNKDKGGDGGDVEVKMNNFEANYEADKRAVEMMVVSVDGKTENIVDVVLDLPSDAANEIKDEIDRATEGKASGSATA